MSFGARLRDLRLKRKLSLQELADAIGTSKAHIWDLENNRAKNPTVDTLTKLSNELRTSIAVLVGENPGDDKKEPEISAMYREFKGLGDVDRETIRLMMERLKKARGD